MLGTGGRNCEGILSAAVTLRENLKTSLLMAEAMGLRWCLKWIKLRAKHAGHCGGNGL